MRITVFTSNQPRHLSLIESLAGIADEVFAVQECNTVFPGRVADFFDKSEVMRRYFERVIAAEEEVFGRPRFIRRNVRQFAIKMGDLSSIDLDALAPALSSDHFVAFGASFIKGPLIDLLIKKRAVNIHMGISPYYRGSSTNFWAMYDRRPEMVGATIHLLSRGLDSGPMLFHAFPAAVAVDPFVYGMLSVAAAHAALVHHVRGGSIGTIEPVQQEKSKELRYTRNADFTDSVAAEYLNRLPTPSELLASLARRDPSICLRPHIHPSTP